MERESFEDEEVATLLNEYYIPVKVDREERPDIDNLYMAYCQALTGQGGWPLTVLLTPDQKPFYAGTYFPKQTKYGRISMIDMLSQIHYKWEHENERILETSHAIVARMAEHKSEAQPGEFSEELAHRGYQTFVSSFDELYGGFGGAPKFPTPHHLMFLSAYAHTYKEPQALDMVRKTLDSMYRGGMHYQNLVQQAIQNETRAIEQANRAKENTESNPYSGTLIKVNKADPATDKLAERIGSESRVKFSNDPKGREFDAISDKFVAQSKPALNTLNKTVREQMK